MTPGLETNDNAAAAAPAAGTSPVLFLVLFSLSPHRVVCMFLPFLAHTTSDLFSVRYACNFDPTCKYRPMVARRIIRVCFGCCLRSYWPLPDSNAALTSSTPPPIPKYLFMDSCVMCRGSMWLSIIRDLTYVCLLVCLFVCMTCAPISCRLTAV